MNAPKISDLLEINPRFVRAVQLERDFGDPHALESYVVTPELEAHLLHISRGFRKHSPERAWRITGDFGTGKSSFALLLAKLLSSPATELPKHVRGLRDTLGLARSQSKYLPILVTGAREPLSSTLLRAYYDAVSFAVDGRRKLRSKARLAGLLADGNCSDRDAISAIEATAVELVEAGLVGGVIVILDELGKFLEFAALHPERQDVYFLQQLGEYAERSGDYPCYVFGLLHQSFGDYAEKLSDFARREWEKVAERYEELVFSQSLSDVAILLASALGLKSTDALRGWKTSIKQDMAASVDLNLFGPGSGKTALIELAPQLYPIHPTVLPVLARFFRRFGQNERSLFSFVRSAEPFALQDFAMQEASLSTVYRLANFYDYAAHNFAHRLSGQSFRSHWNHIDAVIRAAAGESEADIQILKTIGILNVVEVGELQPTEAVLEVALGRPADLQDNLKQLCKRNILFFRGRGGYALWPHASVNLERAFLDASESIKHIPPVAEVIQDRLDTRPIVARKHYIQTGNLRHFAVRFLTANEFARAATPEVSHPADGLLMVVLCETAAERCASEAVAALLTNANQVVVAITSPLESLSGFALELERWHQVERQTLELKDDRFAAEEVSRQIETVKLSLENRIDEYVGFRGLRPSEKMGHIAWFYAGEPVLELNHEVSLQSFLSEICDDLFPYAPRIANELVNRHSISSAAASARQKLFKLMVESSALEKLGLGDEKAPPEKSLYLSVLFASKIHRKVGDHWRNGFPEADADPCQTLPALKAIVEMLEEETESRVNVKRIWEKLRQPPFGVRDGLIPILLLTALLEYETEIAVYEDGRFQEAVEEFLMMRLVKVPATFEFQLCRISGVRREVVQRLATVVGAAPSGEAELLDIVRPLYRFITDVPEYVRNTDRLSEQSLLLRKALVEASEPADLVFNRIPAAFGCDSKGEGDVDAKTLAEQLSHSLAELRRAFPELQARMEQTILTAFGKEGVSFQEWRREIAQDAETVLLGVSELDLRAFALKLVNHSAAVGEWLESLGSFLTRCPPSRWRDRDEDTFAERVRHLGGQFRRVFATYFDREGACPELAVRVAVTHRSGEERQSVLQFTAEEAESLAATTEKLRSVVGQNKVLGLAALSKLMWDLME